jgi:hypothetical protein
MRIVETLILNGLLTSLGFRISISSMSGMHSSLILRSGCDSSPMSGVEVDLPLDL